MKQFPDKLCPKNKHLFNEYKFNRDLCKLRQRITEYLYLEYGTNNTGKKGGFDLKSVTDEKGQYSYEHIDDVLIDTIIFELNILGWKTKLAYGRTTLFVYENDEDIPDTSSMESIDD